MDSNSYIKFVYHWNSLDLRVFFLLPKISTNSVLLQRKYAKSKRKAIKSLQLKEKVIYSLCVKEIYINN